MNSSITLTTEQIQLIISNYLNYKTENTNNFVLFRAKTPNGIITIYTTNKLLLQGKNTAQLFQEIQSLLGIETKITVPNNQQVIPTFNFSYIGSDEVGTGDFFGGIVVCACFVPKDKLLEMTRMGIKDSKQLTDRKIEQTAPLIMAICPHEVTVLTNERYNDLIAKESMNMNKIKAVLHNLTISKLMNKQLDYDDIIIDAFTTPHLYFNYLQGQNGVIRDVKLIEKAENKYIAVAAASIIARYHFLMHIKELSKQYKYKLPKGASSIVDDKIKLILADKNENMLYHIAKLNFNNLKKVKQENKNTSIDCL